jgi:AcrR family transcriptional regulator
MPKLKKEYADSRKKEILRTASNCFYEIGYEKTTMREIARRMNATTGVLYTYFKKKEEILKELQNIMIERIKRSFAEMNKRDSVREAYTELFNNEYKASSSSKTRKNAKVLVRLLTEALSSDGIRKLLNTSFRDIEKRGSKIIEKGIKSGEIHTHIDPKAVSGLFHALWWGLWMQIALLDGLNVNSHVDGIVKILLGNTWGNPKVTEK